MIRTESEAWTAIADTLGMAGMPPYVFSGFPAKGLCEVICMMDDDLVLAPRLGAAMISRIKNELGSIRIWLFRPGSVRPRIALCRRFAKESA